jgi:hypothetical protein
MCTQCRNTVINPEFEAILNAENNYRESEWYNPLNTIKKYSNPLFNWLNNQPKSLGSTPKTTEQKLVSNAIARGERNENALADLIFHRRHPELGGKALYASMPNFSSLSKEWLVIRDTIVRPLLKGGTIPVPPSPAPVSPAPKAPANIVTLRNNIVIVALGEWARWNYGNRTEDETEMQSVILQYWKEGVNINQTDISAAWSAAFVSFVMKKAGGDLLSFPYSSGHSIYSYHTKLNRVNNTPDRFKAYHISEIKPMPGDIIVSQRENSGLSYDTLDGTFKSGHGDIITEVSAGSVSAIGGNVGNSTSGSRGVTVNKKTVRMDSDGYLNGSGYDIIIRAGGASAAEIKPRQSNEFELMPEFETTFRESFSYEQGGTLLSKEQIKELQTFLNRYIGYKIDTDGDWGPNSAKALETFVKKYKLPLPADKPDVRILDYLRKIELYDEFPKLVFEVGYFELNHSKANEAIIDRCFVVADNLTRLISNPGIKGLIIIGYTDKSGSQNSNLQLGYQRAAEVEKVLRCAFNRFKTDSGNPKNLPIQLMSGGERFASAQSPDFSRHVKIIAVYKNKAYYSEQEKGIWRNVYSRCRQSASGYM